MTEKNKLKPSSSARYPRIHLIAVAACSAFMVIALTLLPSPDATATKTLKLERPGFANTEFVEPITAAPDQVIAEDTSVSVESTSRQWKTESVRSGDTLSHIFKRMGLTSRDVHDVMQGAGEVKLLTRIHPGQSIKFDVQDTQLRALEYVISRTDSLLIEHNGEKFVAEKKVKALIPYTSYAEGTIDSSLFLSAQKAGLSQSMTMELANIFGWDVDFVLDIRQGDSFKLIYQEMHLDGEKVKDGDICIPKIKNKI